MNYCIADTHFGHENVIRYDRRPFGSIDDMNREIVKRWNDTVSSEDNVYVLGDFALKNSVGLDIISNLKGRKFLVEGNHDRLSDELKMKFDWVRDIAVVNDNGVKVVLCHYPMAHWIHQYRGAVHLYGHVHVTKDYDVFKRYGEMCHNMEIPFECYNVGCMMEYMDYTPRTLEHIRLNGK